MPVSTKRIRDKPAEPPSPPHGTAAAAAAAAALPVYTNMSTSTSSSSFGINPIPSFLQTSSGKRVRICIPSEQITPSPPSYTSTGTRVALRISESPLFTNYHHQARSSSPSLLSDSSDSITSSLILEIDEAQMDDTDDMDEEPVRVPLESNDISFGINPIPSFLQTSLGKRVRICIPSEQITTPSPPLYTSTGTRVALRISESPLFTDYCQQQESSSSSGSTSTSIPLDQDSNNINDESHETVRMSGRKRRKSTKYQENEESQDAVDDLTTPMTDSEEFIMKRVFSLEDICEFNKIDYQKFREKVPKESVITSSTPPNSFGRRWNNLCVLLEKCLLNMVSICSNEDSKNYLLRGLLKLIRNRLEENESDMYEELENHNEVADVIATLYKTSTKGSLQKRLWRAALVQYRPSLLKKLDIKHGLGLYNSEKLKSLGRADYSVMIKANGMLQIEQNSRSKFPTHILHRTVDFILSSDNCQTISWGTRNVKLSKEEIYDDFPRLMRKKPKKELWRDYKRFTNSDKWGVTTNDATTSATTTDTTTNDTTTNDTTTNDTTTNDTTTNDTTTNDTTTNDTTTNDAATQKGKSKKKRVGRTTFYLLLDSITADDPKILSAVDYVTTKLINENIEVLQDIIDNLLEAGSETRKEMTEMVSIARHFLKNQYKSIIDRDIASEVCFHGLEYALNSRDIKKSRKSIDCAASKFPFFVCDELIDEVKRAPKNAHITEDVLNDAITMIEEAKVKFRLFMEHTCRLKCQQQATIKAIEQLKQHCIDTDGKITKAHLIMDFKMKFEPRSARESTQEHFGKRGIGWHGFLLIFYKMVEEKNDDGTTRRVPKRYNVYLDQIIAEGTKQDTLTVIGLLEAALASIHVEFPFIKELSLQSDNAGCYQGGLILMAISYLNEVFRNKIRISEYLHSETQDGKSQLDGHFAQASSFLWQYLKNVMTNRTNKIITPSDLAKALSFSQGMKNSIIQLIDVRRDRLEKMKNTTKSMITKLGQFFSRVNHVYFPSSNRTSTDDVPSFDKLAGSFEVQAFSEIGRKVGFIFDVQNKKKIDCDDLGHKHIQQWLVEHGRKARKARLGDDDDNNDDDSSTTDASSSDDDSDDEYQGDDLEEDTKEEDDNIDDGGYTEEELFRQSIEQEVEEKIAEKEEMDNEELPDFDDGLDEVDNVEEIEEDVREEHNIEVDGECIPSVNLSRPTKEEYLLLSSGIEIEAVKGLGRLVTLGKKEDKKSTMQSTASSNIPTTNSRRMDAQAIAVRYAYEQISSEESIIVDSQEYHEFYNKAKDYVLPAVPPGWARRVKGKQLYGKNFLKGYAKRIKQLYDVGVKNKSDKKSPGEVREILKRENPGKFSIPPESSIRQLISQLSQQEKNGQYKLSDVVDSLGTSDDGEEDSSRGRLKKWDKLDKRENDLLERTVDEDPGGKPSVLYERWEQDVIAANGKKRPKGLPEKKVITSRISTLKSKYMRSARNSVVVGP